MSSDHIKPHMDPPVESIWQQHRETLSYLYERERKSLKEVMKIMETEHGFPEMM
jgi:hypothetical protein